MGQNSLGVFFVFLLILTISVSIFFIHYAAAYGPYYHVSWPSHPWNQVVVTITDTGTTNDVNMYVWAGYDAGNNRVWSQNQYGPFTLSPGENNKITLPLNTPPADKWTRDWVKVWGDDISTQSYYSNWDYRTCGGAHMSFTIPVYVSYAEIYIDGGYYGSFSGSHSFLVNSGLHGWDLVGHYPNGDTYTWYGTGAAYDCYPYSFIA